MAQRKKSKKPRIAARAELPTEYGTFAIYGMEGCRSSEIAVALVHGKLGKGVLPLVRIHSQCLTGDVFHSERCDCYRQLRMALQQAGRARCGVVIYLPQEGRGIGLINKLRAYELQDGGLDTVQANRKLGFRADHRDYRFCADVLKLLGLRSIRLLSNNPDKVNQLKREGIQVVERVPCQPPTSRRARGYLVTKKQKLGHWLEGI